MKWLKKLFKKKHTKVEETTQLNISFVRKSFCAKPMGEICFGDESDVKCGTCVHWVKLPSNF